MEFNIEDGILREYHGEGGEVIIPEGVTEIGYGAFDGCAGITAVTFPNTLRRIGNFAFWGAHMLREIVLPDGVESVGFRAFYGCLMATRTVIGRGLSDLGIAAFAGCDYQKEIAVDEKNPHFKSLDGVLYTKSGDTLIRFPSAKLTLNFSVPDGVKCIAPFAFCGALHLSSVTLPSSVLYVEREAFCGCRNLSTVTMLNPNTDCDFSVFDDCPFLQSVKRGTSQC